MAAQTVTLVLQPRLFPRAEDTPPPPPQGLPDVAHMQVELQRALDQLGRQWADLSAAQKQQLVEQIEHAARHGQITDLTHLSVDSSATSAALAAAMAAVAIVAARQVVAEAAAQGVEIAAANVPHAVFAPVAQVVAQLLADELRITAARAALRLGPDASAAEVADLVRQALDDLSTASVDKQLGGALHGAMNTARISTLRLAPEGALYAQEMNDKNTCKPCRLVDGTWLGNISDLAQASVHPQYRTGVLALYPDGAYGGYIYCLGGVNCRGTVVGVWRPKTTGDAG